MNNILKKQGGQQGALLFFACLFAFGAWQVQAAEDYIDVIFGEGIPIKETNLAPGQKIIRNFTVINKTNQAQQLQFRLEQEMRMFSAAAKLEDRVFLEISQAEEEGGFLPMALAPQTLAQLDNQPFTFDQLAGSGQKTYQLIFTVDPTMGNEYQDKQFNFALNVGVEAIPGGTNPPSDSLNQPQSPTGSSTSNRSRTHHHHDDDDDEDNNNGGSGTSTGATWFRRVLSGQSNGPENVQAQSTEENNGQPVIGEGSATQQPEAAVTVAGSQSSCESSSLIPWFILALAISSLTIVSMRAGYFVQEVRWKINAAWAALVLLAWYLFNSCSNTLWFPISIVAWAVFLQVLFFWLIRRKLASVAVTPES